LIDWLRHMKIDMTGLAQLDAWSKRCQARPAFAKALARESA
jgi:glutathione S-transferase